MMKIVALVLATALYGARAACPNSCSGHGSCDKFDVCTCYVSELAGQAAKNPAWREPDCSKKTCPRGTSHTHLAVNIPTDNLVFMHAVNSECSDRGSCDGDSGDCVCLPGFTGAACQYSYCSDASTQNGVCQSNTNFALDATYGRMKSEKLGTYPVETKTFVNAADDDAGFKMPVIVQYNGAWDSDLMFGMRCDDGFRGPLCDVIECPSGADPLGFEGAKHGRDCSGRGICDTTSGVCNCFDDFTGTDCGQISATM